MESYLAILLLLVNRYLHVVAAALLIGGTLFYELIVPVAIDELKDPQKLSVFARARWAFRWIVWCSMAVLLITGVISTWRNWPGYNGLEAYFMGYTGAYTEGQNLHLYGAGYWWLAHALLGVLGIGVAVALVLGRTPPRYPLVWMRINLVILLVVIFLASTTRDIRHRLLETQMQSLPQRVGANPRARPGDRAMSDAGSSQGGDEQLSGRTVIAPGVSVAPTAIRIQFSRSGGPGGQNVNKVNSKAEVWVHVGSILGLTHRALARLRTLAGTRLTLGDEIHLRAETARSQEANREEVFDRLRQMVLEARIEPKPRRKTKPSKAAKRRRLESKKHRGEIKSNRRAGGREDW